MTGAALEFIYGSMYRFPEQFVIGRAMGCVASRACALSHGIIFMAGHKSRRCKVMAGTAEFHLLLYEDVFVL
jgi:hypothetical protein